MNQPAGGERDNEAGPLDGKPAGIKNSALDAIIIERQDPSGERWWAALSLLLDAGRKAEPE